MTQLPKVTFPLETVRVKVGLGGSHYHLPECPAAQFSQDAFDYVEIEVPKLWVEKHLDLPMFGRTYRSHIKACKALIEDRRTGRRQK